MILRLLAEASKSESCVVSHTYAFRTLFFFFLSKNHLTHKIGPCLITFVLFQELFCKANPCQLSVSWCLKSPGDDVIRYNFMEMIQYAVMHVGGWPGAMSSNGDFSALRSGYRPALGIVSNVKLSPVPK